MPDRRVRSGIAVLAVTRQGTALGAEIAATLRAEHSGQPDVSVSLHTKTQWKDAAPAGAQTFDGSIKERVAELFPDMETLVFVLAVGATFRLVAPLLGRKRDDPGVICVDDAGQYVVPVLGGHQKDANSLAQTIADAIGATPIVTTASDAAGLPNLDLLGKALSWRIEATSETLKLAAAALLDGQEPVVYVQQGQHTPLADLPPEWPRVDSLEGLRGRPTPRIAATDLIIDPSIEADGGPLLVYRPPTLVLGVGCSLNALPDDVEALARTTLAEAGLAWGSVHTVATIDRRIEHPALVQLVSRTAASYFPGFSADELRAVTDAPTPSTEVQRHVGTPGVCEPAAILGSQGGDLIVPKQKSATATVAVARRPQTIRHEGTLSLVGMGPGPLDLMTPRARRAVREADLVIGYRGYLDLLTDLAADGRLRPYDLGQEHERASEAIRAAREGYRVALVSSGDIGIYGMAGLVYEILDESELGSEHGQLRVEMIPGITAASSANALLGAPLMLDFAAISLSDLLVPWEGIRRRLTAAAEGDLVVVLYNPASARRRQPFEEALSILRARRSPETPVGLVREAYRADQSVTVTTLGDLAVDQVDMRTVVVIGSARTEVLNGKMVTRRGYLEARA